MLLDKPRIPIRQILMIGLLPNFLKKLVYRFLGYRFGRGVQMGFGSVLIGRDVQIGNYARLGLFAIVRGTTIRIGDYSSIGSFTFLDVPHLQIGQDSKINEQVFIGGLQSPDSRFIMGSRSMIQQLCYINPSVSVSIGDDTSIGGHSLIFGHSSWRSELDGYPVTFKPIEIGDGVAVSWKTFIVPGAKIGDGAVVGGHSLVNRRIPPRCLARGSPAKVVSSEPYFPRPVSPEERARHFEAIVARMIAYFEESGIRIRRQGSQYVMVEDRRLWGIRFPRTWRLCVRVTDDNSRDSDILMQAPVHVYLSLHQIPDGMRQKFTKGDVVWIDVERRERAAFGNLLAEEVVMFLKRYGLRFARVRATC